MGNVVIRECKNSDIDSVKELQHKWVKEDITYGLCKADSDYFKSKIGDYFLVAEVDDKIVGFICGTSSESKNMCVFEDGEKYIEVEDLYVLSEYRSLGIGGILLDKMLDKAKENGIERRLLYSSTKNMDSIMKFYNKHGYKSWFIEMYK